MEINLTDLTKIIEEQDYLQDLETAKYADLSKSKSKITEYAEKMLKEVAAAIKHNSLIQTELAVTGQRPVTFALETNIINLPYSNYKKIANFFDEGKNYPVKVYFETRSDYVNVSGFRIDELCSSAELLENQAEMIAKLAEAIVNKLQEVRTFEKPEAKKPAVKKTTKKSSKSSKAKTKKQAK
ncbi:hypothetical protein PT285_09315 [Lactobacillus sp. ESL0791]|uniref:hypothetical protein n=1 Tax=Lactobacillus sp. ESL0791 TaxID=2983234 RepID=UPI0023F9190B|nr:hypothetical protein [Lactobacillus sp. ESL0791]MDF7639597.1 hypothetical protein [Lactobacillus sp. ESL0791]